MTVAEILNKAADLIKPEGAWTQGATARNAAGQKVYSTDEDAVCFCALGAIFKCGGQKARVDNYFGATLVVGGDWWAIGGWNDAPERTQAEVVAKLREAAALAAEQPGERTS